MDKLFKSPNMLPPKASYLVTFVFVHISSLADQCCPKLLRI